MKIVFLTGAGISQSAGIPTFQENPTSRDHLTRLYAKRHPEEYNNHIREWKKTIDGKKPTLAHKLIAQTEYTVITMNVDNLHELAGQEKLIKLHGSLPADSEIDHAHKLKGKPVLYGDSAPAYQAAFDYISTYQPDYLIIIGASHYTAIVDDLIYHANTYGVIIKEINQSADTELPKLLEELSNR